MVMPTEEYLCSSNGYQLFYFALSKLFAYKTYRSRAQCCFRYVDVKFNLFKLIAYIRRCGFEPFELV